MSKDSPIQYNYWQVKLAAGIQLRLKGEPRKNAEYVSEELNQGI